MKVSCVTPAARQSSSQSSDDNNLLSPGVPPITPACSLISPGRPSFPRRPHSVASQTQSRSLLSKGFKYREEERLLGSGRPDRAWEMTRQGVIAESLGREYCSRSCVSEEVSSNHCGREVMSECDRLRVHEGCKRSAN